MNYLDIPSLKRLQSLRKYIKDGKTYAEAKQLVINQYDSGGYVSQIDATRIQGPIIKDFKQQENNNIEFDNSPQHIRNILGINVNAKEQPFINNGYKKDGPIEDIYPELMFFSPYSKLTQGMKAGTFNRVNSFRKYATGVVRNNIEDYILPDNIDPASYY